MDDISNKYLLKNDTIAINFNYKRKSLTSINFNFNYKNQSKTISGVSNLIRLEDNGKYYIPEGSPIEDENTKQNYSCDSTYSYQLKLISITICLEKGNHKRLSLSIDNSNISLIKDHDYTLYKY